jgi:hypothetical protein
VGSTSSQSGEATAHRFANRGLRARGRGDRSRVGGRSKAPSDPRLPSRRVHRGYKPESGASALRVFHRQLAAHDGGGLFQEPLGIITFYLDWFRVQTSTERIVLLAAMRVNSLLAISGNWGAMDPEGPFVNAGGRSLLLDDPEARFTWFWMSRTAHSRGAGSAPLPVQGRRSAAPGPSRPCGPRGIPPSRALDQGGLDRVKWSRPVNYRGAACQRRHLCAVAAVTLRFKARGPTRGRTA